MLRWVLIGLVLAGGGLGGWTLYTRAQARAKARAEMAVGKPYSEASIAYANGNAAEAERILLGMLPQAEEHWAGGSRLADTYFLLGIVYKKERKYKEAETYLLRALELRKKLFAADSVVVGDVLIYLGSLCREEGSYIQAESYYRQSLEIHRKRPEAPRELLAMELYDLGWLAAQQGRSAEAEPLIEEAIGLYQQYLPPQDPALISARRELALVRGTTAGWLGHTSDAPQAVPGDAATAEELYALGLQHVDAGNYKEAERLLRRAVKLLEESPSADPSRRPTFLFGLASACEGAGKRSEAELFYKQALEGYRKTVGLENPLTADALESLGAFYMEANGDRDADARKCLESALAIREKLLGPENSAVGLTLSTLGRLYDDEKKYAKAEPILSRALGIMEKSYGSDSMQVSTVLIRLGMAQAGQYEFPQAEASFGRCLAIREARLPPNHRWIAIALEMLAGVYMEEGRQASAAELLKRAEAIRNTSTQTASK
jgi:tetratricopeptide (TPR) repeat protein